MVTQAVSKLSWLIEVDNCQNVLFLGEGNFSFSAGLVRRFCCSSSTKHIWSTCYESDESKTDINNTNTEAQTVKKENMEYLVTRGCRVVEGVDAEHLDQDHRLDGLMFNKIIFMFPHVGGKMKINRNRELLKNIIINCRRLIQEESGTIIITLCRGQGGTEAETVLRSRADTWRIVDTCHEADCVLSHVEPFPHDEVSDYSSVGYRGLFKRFNVEGSMMHFIKKRSPRLFKQIRSVTDDDDEKEEEPCPGDSCAASLYPPHHTHHLSYWLPPHLHTLDNHMMETVISRTGAGDVVETWTRITQYQDDESGRRSETVELVFCDQHHPLGHTRALHLLIEILGRSLEYCYHAKLR